MLRTICALFAIVCLFHLQVGNFEHKELLVWNKVYAAESVNLSTSNVNVARDYKGVDESKMDISATAGFLDLVNLIVIAMIAKSFLTCSGAWKQPEVIAFIAGAAMFLAGEIVGFLKYQKARKKVKDTFDEKSTDKGAQLASLQAMLENLNNLKSAANTKMGFQSAAATTFTIAAGIAVAKYVLMLTLGGVCTASCAAGAATIVGAPVCGPAAAAAGAAYAGLVVKEAAPAPSMTKKVTTKSLSTTTKSGTAPCPACVAQCSVHALGMDWNSMSCLSLGVTKNSTQTSDYYLAQVLKLGPFEPNMSVMEKKEPGFVERVLDLFVSRAQAGGMWYSGLGLTIKTAALIGVLSVSMGRVVDNFIEGPLGRSIAFAAAAALAWVAKSQTSKIIGNIDKEIEKVNQVIAALQSDMTSGHVSNSSPGGSPSSPEGVSLVDSAALDRNGRAISKFPCIEKGDTEGQSVSLTSSGCTSLKKLVQMNPTINGKSSKTTGIGGLSDFSPLLNQATEIGDSIQGHDSVSSGTLDSLASLAGKEAFASKLLKDMQAKANDELKKSGKGTIDFEKAQGDLLTQLRSATNAELKKQNVLPQDLLANFGSAAGDGKSDKKTATASSSEAAVVTEFSLPDFAMPKMGANSASSTEGADSESLANAATKLEDKIDLDKMDKAGSEIINRPETSIFQVISTRYLKSGMKRLGVLSKSPSATSDTSKKEDKK